MPLHRDRRMVRLGHPRRSCGSSPLGEPSRAATRSLPYTDAARRACRLHWRTQLLRRATGCRLRATSRRANPPTCAGRGTMRACRRLPRTAHARAVPRLRRIDAGPGHAPACRSHRLRRRCADAFRVVPCSDNLLFQCRRQCFRCLQLTTLRHVRCACAAGDHPVSSGTKRRRAKTGRSLELSTSHPVWGRSRERYAQATRSNGPARWRLAGTVGACTRVCSP